MGNLANMKGRPVLDHLLPTNRDTALVVWGPDAVLTFDGKIDTKFPSWPGIGWKGPAGYRLFAEAHSDEPLPTSLVREFASFGP
jgi:hypothetical protein